MRVGSSTRGPQRSQPGNVKPFWFWPDKPIEFSAWQQIEQMRWMQASGATVENSQYDHFGCGNSGQAHPDPPHLPC